jgi:hypothetical protein
MADSTPTSECAIIGLVDLHHYFVISTNCKLRNDINIFFVGLPPPAAVRYATATKGLRLSQLQRKDPTLPEPSEMNGLIQSLVFKIVRYATRPSHTFPAVM